MPKQTSASASTNKSAVDHNAVKSLGRAMWRAHAGDWYSSSAHEARVEDWEKTKKEWMGKARKVLRFLSVEGLALESADGAGKSSD